LNNAGVGPSLAALAIAVAQIGPYRRLVWLDHDFL